MHRTETVLDQEFLIIEMLRHVHPPILLANEAAQGQGVSQGQRSLTCFASKDLYKDIIVPAASSPVHGDAFLVGMLFEQRECEAIEPGKVFAELLFTDA